MATAADYRVVFPDVVELNVAGRPDCPAMALVGPDGRIDLGSYGLVFAEGATADELAARIAHAVDVPAASVQCQVAVARSRVVHLLGSGAGRPRIIPYAGSERVTDVLRRSGGISANADPKEVTVVRRNVAVGRAPETFRIDLEAIRKGDDRTNIVLEPNDEIHIAEDRSNVALANFIPGRP